jgi:hypothetical protein
MLHTQTHAQATIADTHGRRINTVADSYRTRLIASEQQGRTAKLSKTERTQLAQFVSSYDIPFIRNGVDFSRLNFGPLINHVRSGGIIEFETLGPYLQAYQADNGVMKHNNLLNEDAIGLQLAIALRQLFPEARLVSLYDDYNAHIPGKDISSGSSGVAHFSDTHKEVFRESLIELYRSSSVISPTARHGTDYFLISESSKIDDTEALVNFLETKNCIYRKGNEIIFINSRAENPLYHRVHLRNSKGKWLCEALDAATFLKAENFNILHIVALPDYMKSQQDKVWEILRVIGISPYRYHNIFYDPHANPKDVAKTVTDELTQYLS